MTRSIRRDHTEPVPVGEDRRDLVRMEACATLAVPVEKDAAVASAPLVNEPAGAVGLDPFALHRCAFYTSPGLRTREARDATMPEQQRRERSGAGVEPTQPRVPRPPPTTVDELARPDWPPGSVIYRGGDDPNLRVLDVLPSDDPERFDVLVVEPV